MITLTKVDSAIGGQHTKVVYVDVQANDLIFATCSYWEGGEPYLTTNAVPTTELGGSTLRSAGNNYCGDILAKVWEAQGAGALKVAIGSSNEGNLDLYVVVFRPSEATYNVNPYTKTVASDARVWTDELDVYAGEYILCAQYCSDLSYTIRAVPVSGDKGGTAIVTAEDWALPENSTSRGNSFMELLKVTTAGTFTYYAPNPTVMRLTIQGDPASAVMSQFLLV